MKNLGIYIHIPFCMKKCNYCDFNSFSASEDVINYYTDALVNEFKAFSGINKVSADSVFIGGGTPTLLTENNLEKIITSLKENINIQDNAEFTIECNPKTAGLKKFRILRELGVNRLSLGVQSLNDNLLKTLGRVHNLKDFMESFAAARIAGFENINFDLMFAIPGQSEKAWVNTLKKAVMFSPEHISAYGLQLEENTYFYEHQNMYLFPSDEQNRRMYEFLVEFLKENNYFQYEISNFAKPGFHSKHNKKYWNLSEYMGFGLGASSFYKGVRFSNPENMKDYLDFSKNYIPLWEKNQKEPQKDLISEFMFLGLRLNEGVRDTVFKEKFGGKSFFGIFEKEIDNNIKAGLLEREADRIFLSKKGFDLANSVMSDFILEEDI